MATYYRVSILGTKVDRVDLINPSFDVGIRDIDGCEISSETHFENEQEAIYTVVSNLEYYTKFYKNKLLYHLKNAIDNGIITQSKAAEMAGVPLAVFLEWVKAEK